MPLIINQILNITFQSSNYASFVVIENQQILRDDCHKKERPDKSLLVKPTHSPPLTLSENNCAGELHEYNRMNNFLWKLPPKAFPASDHTKGGSCPKQGHNKRTKKVKRKTFTQPCTYVRLKALRRVVPGGYQQNKVMNASLEGSHFTRTWKRWQPQGNRVTYFKVYLFLRI